MIIVFPDMITHTHAEGGRKGDKMKPKRLWEEESPRFAYQTGFTDESPLSVTVTFTQKYMNTQRRQRLGPAWTDCCSQQRAGVHGSGVVLSLK